MAKLHSSPETTTPNFRLVSPLKRRFPVPSSRTQPLCEEEKPDPLEREKLSSPFDTQNEKSPAHADKTSFSDRAQPLPLLEEHSLIGLRVVVVEDEGITQMQLNRLLRQAGLEVVGVAGDGVAGVETVLRESPDLVLMDIRMPRLDGLEATRQILSKTQVCVVMLTAYAEESLQTKAFEIGASGYLLKPITSLTLLPQLEKAYETYKQRLG